MQMTQGNLKPEFTVDLTDEDGDPLNLSDATSVRLVMRRDGDIVIDQNTGGGHVTVSGGTVTYDWQPGDTNQPGDLRVAVVIVWPDGTQTVQIDEAVTIVGDAAANQPVASYDQLVEHMSGREFSPAQERDARRTLRSLTRSLERRLNRRFQLAEATEWQFTDEAGFAYLERSPVKEILSVDGSLPGDVATFGYEGIVATRGGVRGLRPLQWHLVRYTGGGAVDDGDLDDVRLAVLEKASAIMTLRHDDAVTVKDLNVQQESTTKAVDGYTWTKSELEQLEHLRRRIAL